MACSEAPGPRGLAHVNLVSGAVGSIDKITIVKGVSKTISVHVLADAVVSDAPASFAPAPAPMEHVPVASSPAAAAMPVDGVPVLVPAEQRGKRPRAGPSEPVRDCAPAPV
jgi:hypothetical protein